MEGYKFFSEVKDLYSLLSDEQSKNLFLSRIKCDIDDSFSNILELAGFSGLFSKEQQDFQKNWKDICSLIRKKDKKILLYGAGKLGRKVADFIIKQGLDFDGFCDVNYDKISDGELYGKNIYSPEWLFANKENIYVIITVLFEIDTVKEFLLSNAFPKENILDFFRLEINHRDGLQYFEFIDYMRENTVFVDAGCYDGIDSIRFAEKYKGVYSKIYAFEPDHNNFLNCFNNLKLLSRTEVVEAGVSDTTTKLSFEKTGTMGSKIVNADNSNLVKADGNEIEIETIDVVALDEFIKNETVGFIKMDVEGAEMSALIGAKNIIVTQKPMLAICVYHKPGDVLEIMSCLHELVPEYKFYLRHYSTWHYETVLYAVIEN